MKRLSILILLMCMLTGCALPNDTTMSSEPEISEESYTGSDTVIHEKPTEATDIITPSVPLVTEPQPDFFDGKIRVGENDSLYKLNCPAIEKLGSFTSMHILGGSLLIVGNKYPDLHEFVKKDNSCILSLIDLKTGQIHAEASFDQIENADIQICGDRIALKDFESGTIYMAIFPILCGALYKMAIYLHPMTQMGKYLCYSWMLPEKKVG